MRVNTSVCNGKIAMVVLSQFWSADLNPERQPWVYYDIGYFSEASSRKARIVEEFYVKGWVKYDESSETQFVSEDFRNVSNSKWWAHSAKQGVRLIRYVSHEQRKEDHSGFTVKYNWVQFGASLWVVNQVIDYEKACANSSGL